MYEYRVRGYVDGSWVELFVVQADSLLEAEGKMAGWPGVWSVQPIVPG